MTAMVNQKNIEDFIYSLYQDVSVGQVSASCREKRGLLSETSFVYGDSYLPSLYKIFYEVKPKSGEVFYDFGSGGGRVALFAALSFPFSKVTGIELLDDLDILAKKQLKRMKEKLPLTANFATREIGKIGFINADFVEVDVSDADIIYAYSTCYEEKLMQRLALLLEKQVKVGARIITCTKALSSKSFKINRSEVYPMECGQITVHFQEKI